MNPFYVILLQVRDFISTLTLEEGILSGGLLVALYHLITVRHQRREAHEATRRQNALDAIRRFTDLNQTEMIGATGEILYHLTEEEINSIRSFKPIEIRTKLQPYITTVVCASHGVCDCECLECRHLFKKSNTGQIEITLHAAILLRRRFAIYFNSYETLFSIWNSGIADRDIIEGEFKFIYETDDKKEGSKFSKTLKSIDPDKQNFPNSWNFLAQNEKIGYNTKESAKQAEKKELGK